LSILEKEIWVVFSARTIKHFKNLGYSFPTQKDNFGRVTIPRGTKIKVKVEDLPEGSDARLTKICDNPHCDVEGGRHIPNLQYKKIIKSRKTNNGLDLCKKCSFINYGERIKQSVKYENSLEYYGLQNYKQYLLEEFSKNNTKHPSEISYGTHDEYLWNCPKCGTEYLMSLSSRTSNKSNCPFCKGLRVNHTNSLWTTHYQIAKLLVNSEVGYQVTAGSNKRADFRCPNCKYIIKDKKICSITNGGISCPQCSDGISYPEKFIASILDQLNEKYQKGKIFDWSKNIEHSINNLNGNKIYDFYIPSKNYIVETHGMQHYNASTQFKKRSLIEEQENDKLKEELAVSNGIDKYIIIDCRLSELEYIKNSTINSELNSVFDLSYIDWLKCHEFACNSLVKIACGLWNSGNNIVQIAKIMKMARRTILNYLKKGSQAGWCSYDPKEESIKSWNQLRLRKVVN
jgi:predicted RNA-binding Zn-ribbon protein involved in translation (DUF1610 family)